MRETLADELSYGHAAELSETVMTEVGPKKVIHFQPLFNTFSAKEIPKYHGRTPWCDCIVRDPFDSADDYSRNWLFFYRSCNPMTKYVCEYSESDPATLRKFDLRKGLGGLQTEVVEWRTCITTKTDVEIVTIFRLWRLARRRKGWRTWKDL